MIANATNVQIRIYARTSAGLALTGKVAADFALWYRRDGATVPITLSDLATLAAAHTDGGLKEVAAGEYRLDAPDAAFAAGVPQVSFGGTVAGGVVLGYPISLDDVGVATWSAVTRTLTTPAAGEATPADTAGLTLYAGDTWSQAITGLGAMVGAKRIWLAIKRQRDGLDEDARILLDNLTGLLRLNGVAAETAADGSLTVDDASAGDVTLTLEAAATVALQAGKYVYGIKWLDANDDCWTLAEGELLIVRRTVRAVTETDTESSSPGP